MKCKLQQPVKDFMLGVLVILFMFGAIFVIPSMLGIVLVYLEIGMDVFSTSAVFGSPYNFYQALGAYWILAFILSVVVLILGAKVLQGMYLLNFNRRVLKNWFKENIYNCEGN